MKRAFAIVALLLMTEQAQASVITSGVLTVVPFGLGTEVRFSFSGADFSVGGIAFAVYYVPNTAPFAIGEIIPTSFGISGSDPPSQWWGDTGTPGVFARRRSILTISSPTVLIEGAGTLTTTFSLTGSLCGWVFAIPFNPPYSCNGDYPDLQGSGIATIRFGANPPPLGSAPPSVYFIDATYTFVDPIPEPTSETLLSLGVFAILIWQNRRSIRAAAGSRYRS